MFKKTKKQSLSKEELVQENREKTAQQWIPISDIKSHLVYRKDNIILGSIRVYPQNLALLSDSEKRRKVESLTEVLNGEKQGLQIFCIGRPVDLNNYLEWLQEKSKMEQDLTRKMLLKGYIQQASQLASSGEIIERRFYFIITKEASLKGEEELVTKLRELKQGLEGAELTVEMCKEDEYMDVFSLFANPVQAAYEKAEYNYILPTLLNEEGR